MVRKTKGSDRKGTNFMTKRYARMYRFRRFQALDDALEIYFHMRSTGAWVTVRDIIYLMDWDENDQTVHKRVRRIAESLERVGRLQRKQTVKRIGAPLFMRVLE
jgi:hypothetical protein